ncbi:MAG TPA: hypothetical protein PK865_02270 [Candidatus Saccharibacteria bacterium]|nr:hypothetical protein [Candidatus Saccharibacteria bacterium]
MFQPRPAQQSAPILRRRYIYILGAVLLVLVGWLLWYKNDFYKPVAHKAGAAKLAPIFKFNGAPGWRQGPTNYNSMALFSDNQNCFVSVQRKSGALSVQDELSKVKNSFAGSDRTITEAGQQTLTLQTSAGKKSYVLYRFAGNDSSGATTFMNGIELGFVPLTKGFIEISGHCNTAAQLPETGPALQAVEYTGRD